MTQKKDDHKQEDEAPLTETNQKDETPIGDTTVDPEIQKLRESVARAQADYQNLLKRNEREREEMVGYLSMKFLLPLLTQVDHLERAVKLKEGTSGDSFVDGIRSVLGGMEKYLESQGVKKMISLGSEVDPEQHEVMTQMPGEAGKIIQEFEPGYMMGNRVIRHAKVVVGNWE